MFPGTNLGLIVAAEHARNERINRGPEALETTAVICQPALFERLLARTGQWLIVMGHKLKTASAHAQELHLSEDMA